jgi:hypothetical protein
MGFRSDCCAGPGNVGLQGRNLIDAPGLGRRDYPSENSFGGCVVFSRCRNVTVAVRLIAVEDIVQVHGGVGRGDGMLAWLMG